MTANFSNKAAIVGVANTDFSKNSGRSELQLAAECVRDALIDAGLTPNDVDGMVTFTMDTSDEIEVSRAVGIKDLSFYSRVPHGGGAATGCLHQATMAVASGAAEVVVVYRAINGRSGHRYSEGVAGDIMTSDAIHWGWYTPFGLLTPASWVAMHAQRYIHENNVDTNAFFEVAKTFRDYASTNPAALFHGQAFDKNEYDSQKDIVSPLKLYDCCLESDGGSAIIVTTPEKAKALQAKGIKGVLVNGVGQSASANMESMTSFYHQDADSPTPEMDNAAAQAYAQSGLSADDIDAAVIYDAFTPTVLWQLESWGVCDKGRADDFVLAGNLGPNGRLPTNTNGGQLSEAYIHGINGIVEAVQLVRGNSVNQPSKSINHVLVTSGAGVPTGGAILGKLI